MLVGGKTDIGKKRIANQDRFAVKKFDDVCAYAVVCDGMGGHVGGEIASTIAVDSLEKSLDMIFCANISDRDIPLMLEEAVRKANREVFSESLKNETNRGMGTTVVCAFLVDDTVNVVHVGDSRAYVFSNDGTYRSVTKDHSLVQEMIDRGEITQSQAEISPYKHLITRALGIEADVDADRDVLCLKDSETLLLCSDGLSNMVSPDDMSKAVTENSGNPQALCEELVRMANDCGGSDNITIALITRSDAV